jgi:hypothetical protein
MRGESRTAGGTAFSIHDGHPEPAEPDIVYPDAPEYPCTYLGRVDSAFPTSRTALKC